MVDNQNPRIPTFVCISPAWVHIGMQLMKLVHSQQTFHRPILNLHSHPPPSPLPWTPQLPPYYLCHHMVVLLCTFSQAMPSLNHPSEPSRQPSRLFKNEKVSLSPPNSILLYNRNCIKTWVKLCMGPTVDGKFCTYSLKNWSTTTFRGSDSKINK